MRTAAVARTRVTRVTHLHARLAVLVVDEAREALQHDALVRLRGDEVADAQPPQLRQPFIAAAAAAAAAAAPPPPAGASLPTLRPSPRTSAAGGAFRPALFSNIFTY